MVCWFVLVWFLIWNGVFITMDSFLGRFVVWINLRYYLGLFANVGYNCFVGICEGFVIVCVLFNSVVIL